MYVTPMYVDFGEICCWVGIALLSHRGYSTTPQLLGYLSPVFVSYLLIKVSGIPLLESSADKRFGEEPAYQAYKQRTPVLIPLVGRAGSAAW